MRTNFFARLSKVLFIILAAFFISVFIYSCSIFKNSSKDSKGKKVDKENPKKKPPIKRNLLE